MARIQSEREKARGKGDDATGNEPENGGRRQGRSKRTATDVTRDVSRPPRRKRSYQ